MLLSLRWFSSLISSFHESPKKLYGMKLENHKNDSNSDLFPLQYKHGMKSLGELITTNVIGQSTVASVSKCGMTFRYLMIKKKHTRETQQMGLDSILGPFVKANNNSDWKSFNFLLIIYWDLRSAFYFYPVYVCIYMYIQKLQDDSRLKKY